MIKFKKELTLPSVSMTGLETPFSPEEEAIHASVHAFAKNVMRPLGEELDKMSAEAVIAPGSPYYTLFAEAAKLGLDSDLLAQMPQDMAVRVESLIGEEMGWGDPGLGISLAVAGFPLEVAKAVGDQELIDLTTHKIGCWIITQPDKGSDVTMYDIKRDWVAGQQGNKGNLTAKVGKDELVINGQCSAWVSNGVVAQVAFANIAADYGDGFFDANGRPHGVSCIIPLDLPGVSKGKPLDKIGQRSLPQGEIYFDNVKIPRRFAVALKEDFYGSHSSSWSYAGTHMGQIWTGVARSAFEMALGYAHTRKQGGALLIDHQLTRYRIGDMFRRVELCRAVARRSLAFARMAPSGHSYATASAKVTVTQEAMKVVDEAFQLFGGNATSREYPIEKLFRDARASLIEDGENYVLTMRFGQLARELYEQGWAQH